MQRVMATDGVRRRGGSGVRSRRRLPVVAAAVVTGVLALAACSPSHDVAGGTSTPSTTSGSTSGSASASSPSPRPVLAADITAQPALGAKGVNPALPFTVKVANGSLTSVRMTNPSGKLVRGTMAADAKSWTTAEDLGYSKAYKIVASAKAADGKTTVKRSSITTLTPDNQTTPSLDRIGGYGLTDGATYGVGIVPVVHFDEPVYNFAAAEKSITVTTTPKVAGAFYWSDNQNVHWRPRTYWTPGTKVTVSANVYGVRLSKGLYGSDDVSKSFTIGAAQITRAYDNAPKAVNKVKVYRSGKLVRTMNTSMGRHSGTYSGGQYINFYTLEGDYTVLEHDNPAIMSSESYGLSADNPAGYAPEKIYWSTKISTDGIYLHQLTTTIYDQDHGRDVSHGCLNLNTANAIWFYNHSTIGDPVEVYHTGGPKISVGEGGDWSVSWTNWVKGGVAA